MPQVDLMPAYTGGVNEQSIADEESPASDEPDLPAESFFLSKVAELDWIDRNAFIDRSVNSNENFPAPDDPVSNSGKTKESIIDLPEPDQKAKQDQAAYKESKPRRPARIRLFPKRSSSGRKSAVPMAEPSSPKVSCMGRVRSRRDRNRRRKTGRRSSKIQKKRGFWSSFRSIFKSKGRKQPKESTELVSEPRAPVVADRPPLQLPPPLEDPPPLAAVKRFSSARRSDAWALDLEADAPKSERPAPSLGGVKRFTSGRRSDAWAADLAVDVVKSEPSDSPTGEVGPSEG